ncbi:MAG: oxidoreductase [Planctomycetaceae bacterium]|nr:oxidoreductase [Planctomycetaceae bacterium]
MNELHFPLLELAIAIPLVGSLVVSGVRDVERARFWTLLVCGAAFVCTVGAWQDFNWSHFTVQPAASNTAAHDRWDVVAWATGHNWIVIDELSAPLLPLASLLYLLTTIATLRTKVRRFSFPAALLAEAIVLATLSCREPRGVIVLLALGTIPPCLELRDRGKPTGAFVLHMGLFVAAMTGGWLLVEWSGQSPPPVWALAPLVLGILIRSGIAPFHCWVTDLFENATFGRALLFVTPMMGAYAAVRLLLPVAPDWMLHGIGLLALATAVYSAGLALVQREARRFFSYIFLSNSALVLVGLDSLTPIGLTGALTMWLSVGLSLAGFGLTLRALEARHGRLSLTSYHGVYEHTPELAVCFLLTGLASVGFPGTFGFLSSELLVDGAVQAFPYVGIVVLIASALNGIAVLQAYFRLFTGTRHAASVPLKIGPRERIAVLTMAALVLGGGIYPQPGVASRHHAATTILKSRLRVQEVRSKADTAAPNGASDE